MVQTRNAEKSAQDAATQEQMIEQPTEATRESPVAASDAEASNTPEDKKDDGASKARERMQRFKALQARAVSGPRLTCTGH